MPGLFALRPLAAGARADKIKNGAGGLSSHDKAVTEKGPSSRLSSMGAKVLPLPFPDTLDWAPKTATVPSASQNRAKQVSEPLGESVKARICDSRPLGGLHRFTSNASSSSGSEHEPTSVCLAEMVNDFMEEDIDLRRCGRARCNCEYGTCNGYGCNGSDGDDDEGCSVGELSKILQGLTQPASNSERKLLADVALVVKSLKGDPMVCNAELGNCSRGCLRRAVTTRLRRMGYNAAVCKSKWDHSRGFPGGDHEYMDVVGETSAGKDRLLVDLDFRGQFQIARPTHQYAAALAAIPVIFVGRADRLQQLVDVMTDATKRSLKRRAMHLPPWRKPEYMRAKWLSPYRRTTNEVPLAGPAIGCRAHAASEAAAGTMAGLNAGLTENRDHAAESEHEEEEEGAAPLVLDMDLESGVDAVIYKGKVFSVGEKVEHAKGAVLGEALETRGMTAGKHGDASGAEVVKTGRGQQCNAATPAGKQVLRETRVLNADWQPPSVKPRPWKARQLKAGLAALFKEASNVQAVVKAPTEERQQRVMMAVAS